MSSTPDNLLEVEDLSVHFPIYGGILRHKVGSVRAVDGVSFQIRKGEVLGLVGESGSGKTTIGRAIINLLRRTSPDVHLGGNVLIANSDGTQTNVNGLRRKEMLPFRTRIQMIFQDPFSSLNPRMTVQQLVEGPIRIHEKATADERKQRVHSLLEKVGLQPFYAARYPHEFSGGQRQRIGIARALASSPELIIADEPVSALDVSVQAQVINLMLDLKEEMGLTYLFIAHDLSVVYHISDRIAVMYLGDIVEIGTADQIFHQPKHPYSKALLSAVPRPDPHQKRDDRIRLEGDIPSPLKKPSGCGFRTRCPLARDTCAEEKPTLEAVDADHLVACPHYNEE